MRFYGDKPRACCAARPSNIGFQHLFQRGVYPEAAAGVAAPAITFFAVTLPLINLGTNQGVVVTI
jgi:hypothetical protein